MRTRFYIQGMTCVACSGGIEKSIARKNGIESIRVNLIGGVAFVEFDENLISLEDIFSFIKKLGYEPSLEKKQNLDALTLLKQGRLNELDSVLLPKKLRLIIAIVCSVVVVFLSMGEMIDSRLAISNNLNFFIQLGLTLIVMHMGRSFYFKGFKSLFGFSPNMDSLIAISTSAAFFYSLYLKSQNLDHFYFESICVIISLVMFGKSIEERAQVKADSAAELLLLNQNKTSLLVLENNEVKEIPSEFVKKGDRLKILPYSFLAVDGVVIQGSGNLDESNISGESRSVFKDLDSVVFAGSKNLDSSFVMQATSDTESSSLANIIKTLESIRADKIPIARIADKIASVFTPFVIFVSFCCLIFWSFFENFNFAFNIAICVLVISCPCALGLATPLAIHLGNLVARKNGLLFQNGSSFEIAGNIKNIILDKTGTLTESKLKIENIESFCELSKDDILKIAASLEQNSEHIIAKALLESNKLDLFTCTNSSVVAGAGIQGIINNRTYKLGNKKMFLDSSFLDSSLEMSANIVVILGEVIENKERILGVIYLLDSIRESSFSFVENLKKLHIKPFILSGDNKDNTERVANALGIEDYIFDATPESKLDVVKNIKKEGLTLMLGDGVNDSLALKQADVSASFTKANEVAKSVADIIIFNENLNNLIKGLKISKAVSKNIKENLFFAFCYNAICIPLAAGVLYKFDILLNPMIAALAMSLSSLSVVLNAQKLRFFKGEKYEC